MVRISYPSPPSPEWILFPTAFLILLVAVTYGLARERRLPPWYALYGLLLFTGSVYVMTLDKRSSHAPAFRASVVRNLTKPRHSILLGALSLYMAILLFVSSGLLLGTLLGPLGLSKVYLNGREVKSLMEVLPGIFMALYILSVSVFHFVVTRRRIKRFAGTMDKAGRK